MDRRRAAGVLLALAACVAYATAAPTASNHTSLDIYDGAPDGCYYNFQHYGEGDRIMTNEPCLNCTCHNRMLMCYLRVCPFTKPIGQDCTIEKRADQCCPIVTCPDVPVDLLTSTTTSPAEYGATGLGKLDKYGCSIHGKYFPEGSKVPPTPNKPCEHCYCIRNMTTCVMQECTLHVDGCTPIYHKDVCCPVRYSCDHPEDEMPLLDDLSTTVRPTPGFLLTTTTLSPVTQMSQECLYENQIISDGALIKTEKACDHCYCMKGDIVCVVQECGTPMENEGKNCTALAPREGVCCPDTYICEGDEPTTEPTYESDYTTELEKLTTLSPPRRTGSEGSGYRNEPDSISSTELSTFETESEGSGYEQATIHPTVVSEDLSESHKIEPSDEMAPSTGEPYGITTTTKPISFDAEVTTKFDIQKDTESQQYVPTTVSQEEEIGSGDEEIVTSPEILSTASTLPAIIADEPTIASAPNIATTESNKEDGSMSSASTHIKEPTTTSSIIDKDQENVDISTDDNTIEITTETRRHLDEDGGIKTSTIFDEEYQDGKHDSLRTTVAPTTDSKTTASVEKHSAATTTSAPGFEDEIATEALDVVTDSSDGTGSDFDFHHDVSMTASTPLLEEIEKDTTDQESVSSPEKFTTSTTLSNLPTQETIYEESVKPEVIDETLSSNLPTTVLVDENVVITTAEPHKLHETDLEDSSETEPNYLTKAPVSEEEIKGTTTSDFLSTSKILESQKPDFDESSESQINAFTTESSIIDDEIKDVTSADTVTTHKAHETDDDDSSKPEKNTPTTDAPAFDNATQKITSSESTIAHETQKPEIDESSEPEENAFITSAPAYDDETKKTTQSDSRTTSASDEIRETDFNEVSDSQQSTPTTSVPVYDDETKKTTQSDSKTTSKTQEDQGINVDEDSESQSNVPTTAPVFVDEDIAVTPIDTMTTFKAQDSQQTDLSDNSESQQALTTSVPSFEDKTEEKLPVENTPETQENQETHVDRTSEPQQYTSPTSAPLFDDDNKQTTLTDSSSPSKNQEGQETDVDQSSETQYNVPTTIVPLFEDEIKKITPMDTITTFTQESQDIGVTDSSDSQENAPITDAPVYDDESKKTTPSDDITTSKIQESQEPDEYEHAPITSVPESVGETKETTQSDSITTSKIKESSEAQDYTSTPSSPVFDYETKKTTSADYLTTPEAEKHEVKEGSEPQHVAYSTPYADEIIKTSSETIFEANEITTAEPDKGLNTIPSGSLEEETTEFAQIDKYTHGDENVHTESSIDLDIKFSNENDIHRITTVTPELSSQEEEFILVTEQTPLEENINKIDSTEKYDLTKATNVPVDSGETHYHDHLSSTKLPTSESQESSTSFGPLTTEYVKEITDSQEPITTSRYESSSEATETETSIPEKQDGITSPPSYVTVPGPTIADLEENEIINEPRIPGEGDCLLNGVTYRNESAVPSTNKCQSGCRCSSSIIKCDPIICSSPPEYMDNCQATYDSLDSCCPTYVCDHKTETMPPQSHSQMSGTEAPIESPIKCNGDKCVLDENKKPLESSEQCKSGSCASQDETVQVNVPDVPLDRHEECTGSKCTSSDSTDQLCSKENGCQPAPLKPCEGTGCEVASDAISPQNQPCLGDHCETTVKDCGADNCDSDNDKKLDHENECTEKSCGKRKDGSELEQLPPKKCLGPECPTEVDTVVDITTTDNIDTEKVQISSESPSIETDHSTKAPEDITKEYETLQTDIVLQPLSTTSHPDIATTESDKEKISLIYESATEDQEKLEDMTTKPEHPESTDASHEKELTTEIVEKMSTHPPIAYTTYESDFTTPPRDIDQEKTTLISNENKTESDIIVTDKLLEKDIHKESTTSDLGDMVTELPTKTELDNEKQEVTKSPIHMNVDITAKTSAIYDTEEVTKSPHDNEVKVTMNNLEVEIGSTTSKTYDFDTQKTTISSGDETTLKSTDEFITKHETDAEKTPEGTGSDDLIKPDLEEPISEVTQSPEKTSDFTLSPVAEHITTEAFEVTKLSEETGSEEITSKMTDESVTETLNPRDTELEKVTSSIDLTESEDATKKIPVTEPLIETVTEEQKATKSPDVIEFTTVNVIAETDTDLSINNDTLHKITEPLSTESDITVNDVKDETETESSKPDESKLSGTTGSADDVQVPTEKVTKEVFTEQITKSPLSESEVSEVRTTTKPEDEPKLSSESLSFEKSTTLQPETVTEPTTQSISVPDSIKTETEKPDLIELSTRIQPTETDIELATESIGKITTTMPESLHEESDMTTISDRDILTETVMDLVTKPLSEATSEKPSKASETPYVATETSEKTVTESLKEQNTETPDEAQKTTEEDTNANEITQEPITSYVDEKSQEDTMTEEITSKPSVTTDDLYSVDLKTEQPETISHPIEQLDKSTEEPSLDETVTVESSKIDKLETKLPSDDELSTKATSTDLDELSENVTEMVKEPVTTKYQDQPKPIETEVEISTKLPMHDYSDAVDINISNEDDGKELTSSTTQLSEVTEPNVVSHIPTTSSDLQNLDTYTEKPSETPQDSSETDVPELSKVESSTSRDETADIEIKTMKPEIYIDKESNTDEQHPTDVHKLTTVSSQETYTKPSDLEASITTRKPEIADTERINEFVTESVETVTKDTESQKPEEAFEPSQATATESVESITKEQDQGDRENILTTTDTLATKDSDSTPIIIPTKAPEVYETSSELLEMITNPPTVETSTLKHELSEATTSGEIVGDNDHKNDTEIPITVSDLQTVEVITESQPVLIDTATKKQEPVTELMEDIPTETELPETRPTAISTAAESEKSTESPKDEASTTSDPTLALTSIEHHTEEAQPVTTVISAEVTQTPVEIEVQTEKVTIPTETTLKPEPSSVTSAQEEDKLTTAKAEELSTASADKVTKPSLSTTETPATEQPRPIPTEDQSMDDIMTPDEEPSIPPSGTSGYGTDPDYMEEDQTFGPGTCRYGGKVYVSAQQIPRDDPCDFCFCFRSDIICLQQSCPPPIHGCHEEPISGFCCPRYECPVSMATTVNVTTTTTTTTTTLPPHFPVHSYKGSAQKRGCLIKGHTYKVGDVVRASSGPCLHCTCGGDGQMKCDPKQCTPEPMLRQMIAAAVSAKRRR